jgi:hypothetical protein
MQGHLLLPNSITCKLNRIHLSILGQQARHILNLQQRNQALTTQVTSMQQQLKDQAEMMARLERAMHAGLAEVRQGLISNLEGKLMQFDDRLGYMEDRLDATLPPPYSKAPVFEGPEDTSSEESEPKQGRSPSRSCPPLGPPSDGDSSMHEEVGDDSMHEHEGESSVDEEDCYDQYDQEEYDYPDDYGPFEDNEYGYGYV